MIYGYCSHTVTFEYKSYRQGLFTIYLHKLVFGMVHYFSKINESGEPDDQDVRANEILAILQTNQLHLIGLFTIQFQMIDAH